MPIKWTEKLQHDLFVSDGDGLSTTEIEISDVAKEGEKADASQFELLKVLGQVISFFFLKLVNL